MFIFLMSILILVSCADDKEPIVQYTTVDRSVVVSPDYKGVVIPPNIAPLNFMIDETAEKYYVKIHSRNGNPIEVFSSTPKIIIPQKPWNTLLNINRGNELVLDIYAMDQSRTWTRLQLRIINTVSQDRIDDFIVYRRMNPTHTHLTGRDGDLLPQPFRL